MAVVASISSGSIIHMRAARRFAEMAAVLDFPDGLSGLDSAARDIAIGELMNVSLAAVLAANSAVESIVNELFIERTLFTRQHWFPGLRDDIGIALASAWRGVERYDVITKCQIAAAIARRATAELRCRIIPATGCSNRTPECACSPQANQC